MTARVSLSMRTARELLGATEGSRPRASQAFARDELAAAIAKATRATATRRTLRKPKEAKKRTRREETSQLRAQCFERSQGFCECGCGQSITGGDSHWDHFFGRGKATQTLQSTWLLHPTCDHQKTLNIPSAAYWLGLFIRFCEVHGYSAEAARARKRLEWVEARGAP